MRKKQCSELQEKYTALEEVCENLLMREETGSYVDSCILGMPFDEKGEVSPVRSCSNNEAEFSVLIKKAGRFSGVYIDYMDIGGGKTAVIQCDAAGRDISAAMITAVVVPLFRFFCLHFDNWKYSSLVRFLKDVNTIMKEMHIIGRFAALQIGILDRIEREYYCTNAGLNVCYLLRKRSEGIKRIEFPEAPAAGMLPTAMIDEFKLSKVELEEGDILLFPGDGFEESSRRTGDNDTEIFGMERLEKYLEAVFRRQSVSADWIRSGRPGEVTLDYSGDSGSLEDSLMSLLVTELLFRLKKGNSSILESIKDENIPADALKRITPEDFFKNVLEEPVSDWENQYDTLSLLAVRILEEPEELEEL